MTTPACAVSVCMPAFNGARHIGAAIRSVLEQTFADFELLVVDDASGDATPAVVESLRDPRVRLIENRFRLGLPANWNRGLELSRGRYVTVFHQDDVMAPDNLAAKVRFLEAEPTVGFVHSNVTQIDAEGRQVSETWAAPSPPEDDGRHDGAAYFLRLVTGPNLVCAPSVLARREAFERLGGFDSRLPFTADWEMWLRIALFYDVGYLRHPLVSYRRHADMQTETLSWSRQLEAGYLAKMLVLAKHPERVPDVDALGARVARDYRLRALDRMRQALEAGQAVTAGEYLAVAISTCTRTQVDADALGEILDALGDSPTSRADRAELRARQLAHELDARDRTIDAMRGTRVWRAAQRWWSVKRALGAFLRPR